MGAGTLTPRSERSGAFDALDENDSQRQGGSEMRAIDRWPALLEKKTKQLFVELAPDSDPGCLHSHEFKIADDAICLYSYYFWYFW